MGKSANGVESQRQFESMLLQDCSKSVQLQGLPPRFQEFNSELHLACGFQELTAEEHLWFYGCFKGATFAEARAYASYVLERLGLTPDAKRMAEKFSGGMKRRLSFAMSTVGNPRAIFLDEPTTGREP